MRDKYPAKTRHNNNTKKSERESGTRIHARHLIGQIVSKGESEKRKEGGDGGCK